MERDQGRTSAVADVAVQYRKRTRLRSRACDRVCSVQEPRFRVRIVASFGVHCHLGGRWTSRRVRASPRCPLVHLACSITATHANSLTACDMSAADNGTMLQRIDCTQVRLLGMSLLFRVCWQLQLPDMSLWFEGRPFTPGQ